MFIRTLLVLPLLLSVGCQSSQVVDVAPRKPNLISKFVKDLLDKLQTEFNVPEISLGDEVGNLTEVSVVLRGLQTKVDGIGSWGLLLDAETEIDVKGKYHFLYLDVPMLFPFYGKGEFSITAQKVHLGVSIKATYDFVTESFQTDYTRLELSLENPKVRLENLMNDPSVSDFLNELINNLIPDLVKMITEYEGLKPVLEKYTNGIFFCVKTELMGGDIAGCIRKLFQPTKETKETLAGVVMKELKKAGRR